MAEGSPGYNGNTVSMFIRILEINKSMTSIHSASGHSGIAVPLLSTAAAPYAFAPSNPYRGAARRA